MKRKYQCTCVFDEDNGFCIKWDLHEKNPHRREIRKMLVEMGWFLVTILSFMLGVVLGALN
jgi:hypothetical protein